MKITALLENTSACGLPVEHGLSLFVETDACRFLFDMGQTDLFARNAEALGIDLNTADFAVLSHGHYDHGGGLSTFLKLNDHAPVYMSCHAFEPHYNGTEKYIGLEPSLQASGRIVYVDEEKEIAPGLTLYNRPDAVKVMDFGSCGLNVVQDGVMQPEDFRHEQYLLAEENGKRILFSGCSIPNRLLYLPLHGGGAVPVHARADGASPLHQRRRQRRNLTCLIDQYSQSGCRDDQQDRRQLLFSDALICRRANGQSSHEQSCHTIKTNLRASGKKLDCQMNAGRADHPSQTGFHPAKRAYAARIAQPNRRN